MATAAETKAAEALEKWESAKSALKGMREKVAEQSEKTVEAAAVVGGGATGGWLDKNYGDKEILGIKASIVGGSALATAGALDWAGNQSGLVGHFGLGILAYEAGAYVRDKDSSAGDDDAGDDDAGASPRRRRLPPTAKQQKRPITADELRNLLKLPA